MAEPEVHQHEQVAIRLPGLFFGILTIAALYVILRKLHSERSAIAGSLAMAFNPIFLSLVRDGSPYIYITASLTLLFAAYIWVYVDKRSHFGLLVLSLAVILALYSPLGIVWILTGLLMAPLALKNEIIRDLKKWHYILPTTLVVSTTIPILMFLKSGFKDAVNAMFLIPTDLPSFKMFFENYYGQMKSLFIGFPTTDWSYRLGIEPVLNAAIFIVFVLGTLHIIHRWRLKRIRYIAVTSIIGSAVLALNNNKTPLFALVLPMLFICVGLGFSRLFREWNGIFPRNPLAKTIGILPIALIMVAAIGHGILTYFVAYPKSPEVKSALVRK